MNIANKSDALAKWTKNRQARSGYKFTVTSPKDPAVALLRKVVKAHNNDYFGFSKKLRVNLMGRGPRVAWAKALGLHPRSFDSYLPYDKATHFDVYVNERR